MRPDGLLMSLFYFKMIKREFTLIERRVLIEEKLKKITFMIHFGNL
jgi:hypothetical protein